MQKIFSFFVTIILTLFVFVETASAASVSFNTSGGGSFNTGSQITVNVSVNGSEAYNAVTVNVDYSNLTFLSASVTGGWTGVSGPSNSGSRVSFSGALLGSSASGTRSVLSLRFRAPAQPSTATVRSSGTIALANGIGTKVSGGGNTVTYSIKTPPPPPPSVVSKAIISSSTHPNQLSWYNNPEVVLSWDKPTGVEGFSYELNTSADTVPDNTIDTKENSITLTLENEGINYFHIKSKNNVGFSDVGRFVIQFDRSLPNPFGIAKLPDSSGEKYIIYFATNDSRSNIDHFLVKVDGVDFGKQVTGFEISRESSIVEITAVDAAGNTRTEKLVLGQNTTENTSSGAEQEGEEGVNSLLAGISPLFYGAAVLGLLILVAFGVLFAIHMMHKKANTKNDAKK